GEFASGELPDLAVAASLLRVERSKPLIAAVNGPAVAAGFELVLASDLVLATPNVHFAFPEAQRGLVAGGGGIWRLVRAAGLRPALDVLVAGGQLTAERAAELGVVN